MEVKMKLYEELDRAIQFQGQFVEILLALIFKHLEDRKLGVNAVSPISKNVIQRLAIAFVDDIDLCTSK